MWLREAFKDSVRKFQNPNTAVSTDKRSGILETQDSERLFSGPMLSKQSAALIWVNSRPLRPQEARPLICANDCIWVLESSNRVLRGLS